MGLPGSAGKEVGGGSCTYQFRDLGVARTSVQTLLMKNFDGVMMVYYDDMDVLFSSEQHVTQRSNH